MTDSSDLDVVLTQSSVPAYVATIALPPELTYGTYLISLSY